MLSHRCEGEYYYEAVGLTRFLMSVKMTLRLLQAPKQIFPIFPTGSRQTRKTTSKKSLLFEVDEKTRKSISVDFTYFVAPFWSPWAILNHRTNVIINLKRIIDACLSVNAFGLGSW